MKLQRQWTPLLLLLVPLIDPICARALDDSSIAHPEQIVRRDAAANPLADAANSGKTVGAGARDAPIDGKDGRPHAGPFVETQAERERKKAKEVGADEEPATNPIMGPGKEGSLPQSNDGVMDDPGRLGPKDGTRGTENGVSEKSKEGKLREDKKPDPPKEAPPLPHSEEQKIKGNDAKTTSTAVDGEKALLEKPDDLPEKPHDIPHPQPPSSSQDRTLKPPGKDYFPGSKAGVPSIPPEEQSAVIQPLHSLVLSFTMIMFSEIGDKTFLVAALMAMRHPRQLVFSAAYSALLVMTVLSAVLGHAVPTLIPKSVTNFAAAGLFLVFGVKMLLEARKMSPDEGVSEEMKEVEMELEEKEHQQRRMNRRRSSSVNPYVLESGRGIRKARSSTSRLPSPPESPSPSSSRGSSPSRRSTLANALAGANNLLSLLLSPAWVQTFVMTFLGEWGDRSQIATIAMAAGQDYWWVTGGALVGHACCTAAAVIGGQAIAGKVSLKVVTMGGAIAFLVFGCIYLFEAIY